MIRYADDFVILVHGTEAHAQTIKEQTAEFMREHIRLTLSPEKTAITHVDDGFDFLGQGLRKKHKRLTWTQVKPRYWGRHWTSPDGTRLYWPGEVRIKRYRYRGYHIPSPWATTGETRFTDRPEVTDT